MHRCMRVHVRGIGSVGRRLGCSSARPHRSARRLVIGVVFALMLAGGVAPAGSAALVPSVVAAHGGEGWRILPSPSPDGSAGLVDVETVPGGAWAVGFSLPQSGPAFRTVALFGDGSGWRQVSTPDPDPNFNRLDGVATVARNDVWAAGSRSTGTLIEHWDGKAWAVVASPNRKDNPEDRNNLQGMAAAGKDDVWAVGVTHAYDDGSSSSLIEHWNGKAWRIVPSPSPEVYTALIGVDARSSSDAWAVGYSVEATGVGHTVALHWNGISWTVVPTPSPGLVDDSLSGVVALAPDDAWAVGYSADSGVSSRTPLVLHWDGVTWTIAPSPALFAQLNGIAAAPGGRLWAVGYKEWPADTLAEQWDGSRWTVRASDNRPRADTNALFGVAVAQNGRGWAVGSSAFPDGSLRTLVERSSMSPDQGVHSPLPGSRHRGRYAHRPGQG